VGLSTGLANYQGDLTDGYYDPKQTHGHIGVSAAYEIYDQVMIKGGFTYASISGSDRFSNKSALQSRNLSAKSSIAEFSVTGELYLNNLYYKRYSPYLFAGIALFHYNPYTYDSSGTKVFLKPLSTEGQGLSGYRQKPYSLTQLAFPFGGGIKFALTDNIRIGLEIGLRKTFTDYLDDVSTSYADPNDLLTAKGQQAVDLSYRGDELPGGSAIYPAKGAQRGGEKYKDLYYFSGLNISFRIGKKNNASGLFHNGKKGSLDCPKVPQ